MLDLKKPSFRFLHIPNLIAYTPLDGLFRVLFYLIIGAYLVGNEMLSTNRLTCHFTERFKIEYAIRHKFAN